MAEKTYKIGGKKFTLAPPTIKRLKRIEQLTESVDDIVEGVKLCLEGDIESVDWEEVDIRLMTEVVADFLSAVNPTVAAQMKRSLGLNTTETAI